MFVPRPITTRRSPGCRRAHLLERVEQDSKRRCACTRGDDADGDGRPAQPQARARRCAVAPRAGRSATGPRRPSMSASGAAAAPSTRETAALSPPPYARAGQRRPRGAAGHDQAVQRAARDEAHAQRVRRGRAGS
jgi:hypothetical protein